MICQDVILIFFQKNSIRRTEKNGGILDFSVIYYILTLLMNRKFQSNRTGSAMTAQQPETRSIFTPVVDYFTKIRHNLAFLFSFPNRKNDAVPHAPQEKKQRFYHIFDDDGMNCFSIHLPEKRQRFGISRSGGHRGGQFCHYPGIGCVRPLRIPCRPC